jgi:protein-disulfide isomerase
LVSTWQASNLEPQRKTARWRNPLLTAIGISIALAIAASAISRRVDREQLAQTQGSIQQILANEQAAAATGTDPEIKGSGFTGRRPRGADPAPARLVVFHDYQCKDCEKLDAEIELLMKQYPGLNVSMRHYPMCSKCNPHISWDFFHQEACHDAYLAEAAESLAGPEAFWELHEWLFSKSGSVSEDDLRGFCNERGWNFAELDKMAQSESVKHVVEGDIAEAHSLGATGTPFVFLNGIEVRGASSNPGNVRLAVEKLLATDPVPRPIGWDRHPPSATERLLAEWKAAEPVATPARDAARMVFGAESSSNRVLVFLEPTDRDALPLWKNIERLIRDQADARIELYLFPISRKLNPKFASSASEMYPRSTEVTQLIAALHLVVDLEALPAAITWCLEASQTATGEELLDQTVKKLGISKQTLRAAIEDKRVEAGIKSDLRQAGDTKVTWAPALVVQGRKAPTPRVSYDLIRQMLQSEPASP